MRVLRLHSLNRRPGKSLILDVHVFRRYFPTPPVIPAKAGISAPYPDSRLRGNDGKNVNIESYVSLFSEFPLDKSFEQHVQTFECLLDVIATFISIDRKPDRFLTIGQGASSSCEYQCTTYQSKGHENHETARIVYTYVRACAL